MKIESISLILGCMVYLILPYMIRYLGYTKCFGVILVVTLIAWHNYIIFVDTYSTAFNFFLIICCENIRGNTLNFFFMKLFDKKKALSFTLANIGSSVSIFIWVRAIQYTINPDKLSPTLIDSHLGISMKYFAPEIAIRFEMFVKNLCYVSS